MVGRIASGNSPVSGWGSQSDLPLPLEHQAWHDKGRYIDNIFIERLWRSLTYEEVYLYSYESMAEARAGIGRYFDFFNDGRPHEALGCQTLARFYDGLRGKGCLTMSTQKNRQSIAYPSPPRPPSRRLRLAASGDQYHDYNSFFYCADSTLAGPDCGTESGVHLKLLHNSSSGSAAPCIAPYSE